MACALQPLTLELALTQYLFDGRPPLLASIGRLGWGQPATAMFDHVSPPRPRLSAMSFIYVRNTVTMMPMKNKGKEQLLMYIYVYEVYERQ